MSERSTSKILQYVQGLWKNVISYTMRDAITAAINIIVVTFCFFFISFVMKTLSIKLDLKVAYIKQSCVIIVTIYMLTIMITSLWYHSSYIKHSAANRSDSEPNSEVTAEKADSEKS